MNNHRVVERPGADPDPVVQDLSTEALLMMREPLMDDIERTKRQLWEVERVIHARMIESGATILQQGELKVEIVHGIVWDRDRLIPLLELEEIPPAALAEAYIPAHQETMDVPASWDMTKVKPLASYGDKARAIIDSARRFGDPKLKFSTVKAKAEEPADD